MNKNEFEGNWNILKGKIKEKWGKFTNDDIAKMNGKYDQFVGQLEKKYNYTKEQVEREMKSWQEGQQKAPIYPLDSRRGDRPQELDNKDKKRKAG